jgi:hypothetical protein
MSRLGNKINNSLVSRILKGNRKNVLPGMGFKGSSPTTQEYPEERSPRVSGYEAERKIADIDAQVKPLVEAREQINKIHNSSGFFENHYKRSDKKLKKLMHQKMLFAIGRMISGEPAEEKATPKEEKNIHVTINLER